MPRPRNPLALPTMTVTFNLRDLDTQELTTVSRHLEEAISPLDNSAARLRTLGHGNLSRKAHRTHAAVLNLIEEVSRLKASAERSQQS